jgi:glycopeptide antibiotics resistance protein
VLSGHLIWAAWPVPAAAVVWWQRRQGARSGKRESARWPQLLGAVGLVTYAWWICSVAFFPLPLGTTVDSMRAAGELAGMTWVNLAPMRELIHSLARLSAAQIAREFGGNFLLLVPFTLFAPLFWPRLRSWWWPLAAGLGGSLAIELLQLVISVAVGYPYRRTDIDDIIVNTSGAFLGYAFSVVWRRLAVVFRPSGSPEFQGIFPDSRHDPAKPRAGGEGR